MVAALLIAASGLVGLRLATSIMRGVWEPLAILIMVASLPVGILLMCLPPWIEARAQVHVRELEVLERVAAELDVRVEDRRARGREGLPPSPVRAGFPPLRRPRLRV